MISPGIPPSVLGAGAAGLAAGAAAGLSAFLGAGLGFFLLFRESNSLPSAVMIRHRATSMANTSVMLVSTTVPSAASSASRAIVGIRESSFIIQTFLSHKKGYLL